MKSKPKMIILILMLMLGIGIILYPTLSDYVNSLSSTVAIRDLNSQMAQIGDTAKQRQRLLAEKYNAAIGAGEGAGEEYETILNFGGGLMGYLQIPCIGVNLPVFHGVAEETLAKGVGHMPQTAFPIGGVGNHPVLTGHTGLPSAELFTDLVQVQEGDLFYITVLDETIVYSVDQIKVVLPDEADTLSPVPGMDCCTLVTCTPYGINSHRLLVRGQRVETGETEAEFTGQPEPVDPAIPPVLIAGTAAILVLLIALIVAAMCPVRGKFSR